MKIVHELNQLDFGGVEKIIRNIVKYDKKNEHCVAVYKDGKYRSELEKVGAKIILLSDEDINVSADLIHIHSGGAKSPMAYDLKGEFPVIETIHSPIRSANGDDYVTQRVGVTKTVASLNKGAITILNGIDFESMVPDKSPGQIIKELKINPVLPVVGRLGRIGKDKGLEQWILTCYYAQQQGFNFTPIIIGDEARDCEGYRGKLKLMIASLPVENVIWIPNQLNIADYLQIMEVFLYPSPTEGFGLSLIEAAYMDAVVVTYNNDVNKEILAGYAKLVDKNIPALVEGLKTALDHNYQSALSGIAREWVETEFDAERMSLEYQCLYGKVLDECSNRHLDKCHQS